MLLSVGVLKGDRERERARKIVITNGSPFNQTIFSSSFYPSEHDSSILFFSALNYGKIDFQWQLQTPNSKLFNSFLSFHFLIQFLYAGLFGRNRICSTSIFRRKKTQSHSSISKKKKTNPISNEKIDETFRLDPENCIHFYSIYFEFLADFGLEKLFTSNECCDFKSNINIKTVGVVCLCISACVFCMHNAYGLWIKS